MFKKLVLLSLFFVGFINCSAQILFEQGYFIDQSGNKVNCLIFNKDWRYNPEAFDYKINEQSEVKTVGINNVKEFGIGGFSKYIRDSVNIDLSSNSLEKISDQRSPEFSKKLVFLKVLIESEASLLYYETPNMKRYFFKIGSNTPEQLIYKKYRVKTSYTEFSENNYFKQQLFNNFNCQSINEKYIERLKYHKKDIEGFFKKYFDCKSLSYTEYGKVNSKRDIMNISLRPGVGLAKMRLNNSSIDIRDTEFDNEVSYRFGVEFEFILPFNKNKWAIILEPTFQSFNATKTNRSAFTPGSSITAEANYSSLELPIGLRYYAFLNEHSKLFLNISPVFDFAGKSKIEFRSGGGATSALEINSIPSISFGLGYKVHSKYALEFRSMPNRELLGNYVSWDSNYRTITLIFSYSIF